MFQRNMETKILSNEISGRDSNHRSQVELRDEQMGDQRPLQKHKPKGMENFETLSEILGSPQFMQKPRII